jgi:hypothetical protein
VVDGGRIKNDYAGLTDIVVWIAGLRRRDRLKVEVSLDGIGWVEFSDES